MGDAIGHAIADFDSRMMGLAQIGAGMALVLLGLVLLTGTGKLAARVGVRAAKVAAVAAR